jgi:hypothetical protein
MTLLEMEGDTSTPTALGQLHDGPLPEGPHAIRFTSATLVPARPSESETAIDARSGIVGLEGHCRVPRGDRIGGKERK